MEHPARMIGEPLLDLGMFVGGVVVGNGMDASTGPDRALDGVEELDEFLMSVARRGGLPHGSARILATVAAGSGFLPGLGVLSRNRPSTPCSANRCCHRHTAGRLASVWRATASTGRRSADKRTIRAR